MSDRAELWQISWQRLKARRQAAAATARHVPGEQREAAQALIVITPSGDGRVAAAAARTHPVKLRLGLAAVILVGPRDLTSSFFFEPAVRGQGKIDVNNPNLPGVSYGGASSSIAGGHLVHREDVMAGILNKRGVAVTKPISDKAEIALEYPDKLYVGTFERSSRFEAHVDQTGIALILERPGAEDVRKLIHLHINFGLFADILRELASTVGRIPEDDVLHRDQLAQAVTELHKALGGRAVRKSS